MATAIGCYFAYFGVIFGLFATTSRYILFKTAKNSETTGLSGPKIGIITY